MFDEALVDLPTLHLGTSRPRRISSARKRAMVEVAAATTGVSSVQQLMASAAALGSSSTSQYSPPKAKSASKFSRDMLFNYWMVGRREMSGSAHIGISCDAGRIGGDDLLLSAVWSSSAVRGIWAPPQAIRSQEMCTYVSIPGQIGDVYFGDSFAL